MLESYVVKQVVKFAESKGWLHRKVVYVGRHGAPDDWFFKECGRLIIIEFKKPGEEPEVHQWREINRLRDRGFDVYVIDDIEAGKALFGWDFSDLI